MVRMLFKYGSCPFGCGRGQTYQVLTDHTFERRGSIEGDDLTMVDDGDAITIFSFFHVVCRHKDGESRSLAQAQHMLPDAASRLWIKAYGWLIEKERLWFVQQSACNLQTTFHTTGEGFYDIPAAFIEANKLEHIADTCIACFAWRMVDHTVVIQVLFRCEIFIKRWILKDDTNALAHLRSFAFNIIAIDPRPPAGRMEQSTQHFDRSALPRPIGTKKAKGFAAINVEVYSLHCLYFPEGAR